MKKMILSIFMASFMFVTHAQTTYLEKLFAVQPAGSYPESWWNGNVIIQKPNTGSAQFINMIKSGSTRWSLGMVYNSSTFAIGQSTSDDAAFTNPTFNITATGNIGIGYAIPENILEVRGNSSITAGGHDVASFKNAAGSAGVLSGWYANGTAVTGGWSHSITNLPYYLGTSSKPQAITILNNGNVGIGTTIPDCPLTVNGTIHATEVNITMNVPLPDYVFEPNYNLISIGNLQTFIKKNGHLPDVPSAEEVKNGGLDMAKMQVVLLRKVEELTLYIIDQQKELTALKNQLNSAK